ncbi:Ribosomal protein S18 acetylase RimI [Yoonia tamlensis]|uniref:Ribosomal protein S18 acetylase RimI n=1 Tax=Yoonia tamlensis TaxID=390270 RepID=A0A1I6G139_9RHOB|nr:N-acetyltransferase [Yoonia tamlensis]SFR35860.1 Ribosomal protein S18 acetylase RimI [Yoonia tamlensis]
MITLRAARADDWDAIWPLLRDVFRAGTTYAVDPQITKADARVYWMGAAACYVAESPDGIVGTYYIKTNQAGGGAHICNCGYIVGSAARGQGLARKMCAHSQDAARAMGYLAIQFNFVLASNHVAVRLWRDMGFAVLGTIPDAFVHPSEGMVAAHIMHKPLV